MLAGPSSSSTANLACRPLLLLSNEAEQRDPSTNLPQHYGVKPRGGPGGPKDQVAQCCVAASLTTMQTTLQSIQGFSNWMKNAHFDFFQLKIPLSKPPSCCCPNEAESSGICMACCSPLGSTGLYCRDMKLFIRSPIPSIKPSSIPPTNADPAMLLGPCLAAMTAPAAAPDIMDKYEQRSVLMLVTTHHPLHPEPASPAPA